MSLENTLSNLSLYDAKKYFRKAQNIVFSYTDMEAKVREATNNEPWGTPSSLMEQISQGTYNYKEREEIIGMIFKRFTEKTATEWRQIYKALQLLEYIIKHGSERFIDDCRANISLVSMLKDFHYIDSQGQDQGLNVRTRAKSIVDLLKDDTKIRQERRHARETSEKYQGIGSHNSRQFNNSNKAGGFNKTSTKGVSVSADFDEEGEGGFTSRDYSTYDSTSYGEYKEHEYNPEEHSAHNPSSTNASQKADITPIETPNLLGDEDDDDDEFSDFHAAPAASVATASTVNVQNNSNGSTLNNLNSLYSNNTVNSNGNSNNLFAPTATSSAPRPQAGSFAAATKPKNDDIFGSLLTAAKANKPSPRSSETMSPAGSFVPSATSPSNTAVDGDDDDEFGDLVSDVPSNATPNTGTSSANQSSGEIDLLSF